MRLGFRCQPSGLGERKMSFVPLSQLAGRGGRGEGFKNSRFLILPQKNILVQLPRFSPCGLHRPDSRKGYVCEVIANAVSRLSRFVAMQLTDLSDQRDIRKRGHSLQSARQRIPSRSSVRTNLTIFAVRPRALDLCPVK